MIDPQTDNICCDVCGADCGYYNHQGDMGFDRRGVWRDLCKDCWVKHKIASCINCKRLYRFDQMRDCECPECSGKSIEEQGKIEARVLLEGK